MTAPEEQLFQTNAKARPCDEVHEKGRTFVRIEHVEKYGKKHVGIPRVGASDCELYTEREGEQKNKYGLSDQHGGYGLPLS